MVFLIYNPFSKPPIYSTFLHFFPRKTNSATRQELPPRPAAELAEGGTVRFPKYFMTPNNLESRTIRLSKLFAVGVEGWIMTDHKVGKVGE